MKSAGEMGWATSTRSRLEGDAVAERIAEASVEDVDSEPRMVEEIS